MTPGRPSKAGRAALIALSALAACGDSRASSQPFSNAAIAAPVEPPAGRPAILLQSPYPYPRVGRCEGETCSWFEARGVDSPGSSDRERLIHVTVASGRSTHRGEAFPANASSARIDWAAQTEQLYVLCSPWRPSVMRGDAGPGWQQVRIDLVRGRGDFEAGPGTIYGLICHPGENWLEPDFFSSRGYRPSPEAPIRRIDDPRSLGFIHPNDPEHPERGGMAVHSSVPPPMVVTLEPPTSTMIDARPMEARADHFELFAVEEAMLRSLGGAYRSMADCERARAERWARDRTRTLCAAGERKVIR